MTPRSNTTAAPGLGTPGLTIVGLFTDRDDAEAAIRELRVGGFLDHEIGIALRDLGQERRPDRRSAVGGAATGAVGGGLLGGLIGLLGSLLIPGVGPIVVGGVLASVLTGAGIGAATGGIIGALVSMGVPETDARHFDEGLRNGRTLVTVEAGDRTGEALLILERHGIDLGPSGATRYGRERRARRDAAYAGPERRLVGV